MWYMHYEHTTSSMLNSVAPNLIHEASKLAHLLNELFIKQNDLETISTHSNNLYKLQTFHLSALSISGM